MRRYLIDNQEVRREEWQESFKNHPNASIILRTNKLSSLYQPPLITETPIDPEKAKAIRKQKIIS